MDQKEEFEVVAVVAGMRQRVKVQPVEKKIMGKTIIFGKIEHPGIGMAELLRIAEELDMPLLYHQNQIFPKNKSIFDFVKHQE